MSQNSATADAANLPPHVLDTRPIFDRGGTPCGAIDAAVQQLQSGQSLVLIVPFEPIPLYTKLGNLGFDASPETLEDGSWRVEFRPTRTLHGKALKVPPCSCSGAL